MKPADRLTELFLTTQRAIATATHAALKARRVSTSQHEALGHMAASGPIMMTQIAEKMGHSTAASTGLVDRLAALGFVQRDATPGDRRRITVTLTAAGNAFLDEMRGIARTLLGNGLAAVPNKQDAQEIVRILETVSAHLTA